MARLRVGGVPRTLFIVYLLMVGAAWQGGLSAVVFHTLQSPAPLAGAAWQGGASAGAAHAAHHLPVMPGGAWQVVAAVGTAHSANLLPSLAGTAGQGGVSAGCRTRRSSPASCGSRSVAGRRVGGFPHTLLLTSPAWQVRLSRTKWRQVPHSL